MEKQARKPETASYGKLSEITGKTYRTLKKLLSEANLYPVEIRTNAVLFDRLQAIEALEMPEGNELGMSMTPLVFFERIRAIWHEHDNNAALATRAIKAEITEVLWFIDQVISYEIGFLLAHLIEADPRLMQTDLQYEMNKEPLADLQIVVDRCTAKFKIARNIKLSRLPADPYERCKVIFNKFAAIVTPAFNALPGEISGLGMNLDMPHINRRIARARRCIEEFRQFFERAPRF